MDDQFRPERMSERVSRHQRGETRDSMLLAAAMRFAEDQPPVQLRVRNLSAGGLMAECPVAVEAGQAIEVELRNIGWVSGTIAWVNEGRIGVALSQRIDPQLARKPVTARPAESMIVKRPIEKSRRPGLRIE